MCAGVRVRRGLDKERRDLFMSRKQKDDGAESMEDE
jgi:hypothetical protein